MTRRLALSLLAWLILLSLSGCGPAGRYTVTVLTEGSHQINAGERLESALLQIDGKLTVEEQAELIGSALILGGEIQLDGVLEGNLSVIDGVVHLGPKSQVEGDLILAGGTLDREPGAEIIGQSPQSQYEPADLISTTSGRGLALPTIILRSILQGILAYAAIRFLPQPIDRITAAILKRGLASGAVGIFTGLIGLILMVQMAFTVVLIPMSLMLGVLFLLAVSLTGIFYGHALGRWLRDTWLKTIALPTAAALGAAIYSILTSGLQLIPYVGAALQLVLIAAGIGALILTRLGTREFSVRYDRRVL